MKYIVIIRENGRWVEQGDGPLSHTEAVRIAQELNRYFPSTRARAVRDDQADQILQDR